MSSNPVLSIVIPVYNTSKYLRRCLDSILEQSYQNIEVIIVNDCSPDNSAEIIQEYCLKDSRVRAVTHEENRGLFRARLTGSAHASGEYIAFVDSDDYVSLDFYRPLITHAEQESCDIVAGSTVRELSSGNHIQYTNHKICFPEKKLCGEDVRNTFFAQEGSCFAWHTVWNKVYRKALWDRCVPEYQKITEHLIMTEDIAFSSVLFYYAQSFLGTDDSSSCYFYCENGDASTNTQGISVKRFQKNMKDMILVFGFVDNFLISVGADKTIRDHFLVFRSRYHRMWGNLQKSTFKDSADSTLTTELVRELGAGTESKRNSSFSSFEQTQSSWYPHIEQIRKRIIHPDIEIVSFDIFDTLLLRPLWHPDDLFQYMQPQFEKICPTYHHLSFKKLRIAAESQARSEIYKTISGAEDVTIDEIYQTLSSIFSIPIGQAKRLQAIEENLEISLSQPRNTAQSLFEFARSCGKQIILTSDMYLNAETIEAMLNKNGYHGYKHLFLSSQVRVTKASGKLYDHVISEMAVPSKQILHIGDNWNADIQTAKAKGMQTAFLPKTKDRFCNTVGGAPTNCLASIGCLPGGHLTTWNKLMCSVGYRSMAALVANQFFDNPYASWNPRTDLDANPFVMGYYAVGMHLIGITKWIAEIVKKRNIRDICFLARDGYLPMMAFDMMKRFLQVEHVHLHYVACSRIALMPWIIENEHGLYALPIEIRNHTPMSVLKLISFCITPCSSDDLEKELLRAGFECNTCFTSQKQYHQFINWIKEALFSKKSLEKAQQVVTAYYSQNIPEGSFVFDLGYSGRILSGIRKALSYPVTFGYVHEDNDTFSEYCRRDQLDVEVMYDHTPPFSGLIREYFLSETGMSCIGFREGEGNVVPILDSPQMTFDETFIAAKIKEGARRFIRDYMNVWQDHTQMLSFNPVHVSMPFEGLIHSSLHADRSALSMAYSDDTVYGQNAKISMAEFWNYQSDTRSLRGAVPAQVSDLQVLLREKSRIEKFIVYAICDWSILKDKIGDALSDHPLILNAVKAVYRLARYLFKKLKGA